MFQSKGRVLLLGDFNARVGKSNDVYDVLACLRKFLVTKGKSCCKTEGWTCKRTETR